MTSVKTTKRRIFLLARAIVFVVLSFAVSFVWSQETRKNADDSANPKSTDTPQTAPSTLLIRLPLPILGNADNQIKATLRRAVSRLSHSGGRPTLVLEFSPGAGKHPFGEGTEFERASSLATFLTSSEVAEVKTIAFIPRTIKGHAVLVAMACDEIVMSEDAEIGEAGSDEAQEKKIRPQLAGAYADIAERRRTVPPSVALSMLDRSLELLRVETDISAEFILRRDLDELRARRAVAAEEVISPSGEMARFTGAQAREFGMAKYCASDRVALARQLGIMPNDLQEDPSLGGDWEAILYRLSGPIDHRAAEIARTTIDEQIRNRAANLIFIEIDSAGGPPDASLSLANYLAGFDSSRLRTVAYVPSRAEGVAMIVALACDHVAVQPQATFGGRGAEPIDKRHVEEVRQEIRDVLSGLKGRSWSLPVAMLDTKGQLFHYQNQANGEEGVFSPAEVRKFRDANQWIRRQEVSPKLQVFRYEHLENGQQAFFSLAEWEAQPDSKLWRQREEITALGMKLQFDGRRAVEMGLANTAVQDFDELKQLYALSEDPQRVEPGWVDVLVRALARPGFAILLLVIAIIATYAELQAPGVGLGGFIASVCLLLFFWSKFLDQTAGWLEVMLFLGGLTFLLLEIFVVPGFGIFGLGGGLMLIISLVLASQTYNGWPRSAREAVELRDALLVVAAAGAGSFALGAVMHRYLPHAPLFGRMYLSPPAEEQLAREQLTDYDHLVGAHGTTATQLTPSGKARFGADMIDVIADGEVIPHGAEIVVVEVRGNRVLVQTVSS
ncbi:MAG: hypothetical protein KDA42_04475 [Planctomycetales bacterium]|nr:hypothetical protein [Planctomycetales bacterium]